MPWHKGDYPPSYKNQPSELREKAVEIANGLLQDGAEEGVAIATGLKQARELLKNHHSKTLKQEIMAKNHNQQADNAQENTNQNANSAYSGSGSMQPGGSNGEQGKLNDYQDDQDKETDSSKDNEDSQHNPGGKSISEATDPSKLSDL